MINMCYEQFSCSQIVLALAQAIYITTADLFTDRIY